MKTPFSIAVLAVLLCACATSTPPASDAASLPLQNAVYVVGENPAATAKMPDAASGEDISVVKRVYWYFAGR